MSNKAYIDDDCIIKDETFLMFQNLLICDICKKILKNPMMCKNCQKVFCKACIDKRGECPSSNCLGSEFIINTDKQAMLKMIIYSCRNCKEEVKYDDVEKHLKNGCITQTDEPKLADTIRKKPKLRKLTPEEVKKAKDKGEKIYHLSSKNIFYLIIILIYSYNFGKRRSRENIFN